MGLLLPRGCREVGVTTLGLSLLSYLCGGWWRRSPAHLGGARLTTTWRSQAPWDPLPHLEAQRARG